MGRHLTWLEEKTVQPDNLQSSVVHPTQNFYRDGNNFCMYVVSELCTSSPSGGCVHHLIPNFIASKEKNVLNCHVSPVTLCCVVQTSLTLFNQRHQLSLIITHYRQVQTFYRIENVVLMLISWLCISRYVNIGHATQHVHKLFLQLFSRVSFSWISKHNV